MAARGVGLKRHGGNLGSEEGSSSYTTQPAAPVSGPCNNTAAGRSGDLTELLRACLSALQVPDEQTIAVRPRPPPLWTAGQALAYFTRLLTVLPDGSPLTAFLPSIPHDVPSRALRCRVAVASTLIAGLERARDGAVVLDQQVDWMPIHVTRRAHADPEAVGAAPPA